MGLLFSMKRIKWGPHYEAEVDNTLGFRKRVAVGPNENGDGPGPVCGRPRSQTRILVDVILFVIFVILLDMFQRKPPSSAGHTLGVKVIYTKGVTF